MTVVYQASFKEETEGKEKKLFLKRILPDGSSDNNPVDMAEINQIQDICENFKWNQSPDLLVEIGTQLFNILNGNKQSLSDAIKKADELGEKLHLIIKDDIQTSHLPFETLFHNGFICVYKIHLLRQVTDFGKKRKLEPENRSLKILFMACSPRDTKPVLDFEKEEEKIFEITKDLPVEIDVEDTGSLEGLEDRLKTNKYDVVHITGHASLHKNGNPYFLMEDEEGFQVKVSPSELREKLDLNLPRLVFLSGCRTGESTAAYSFAHYLVLENIPSVIGWGLPVSDQGATLAAEKLYSDLSRGENILYSLQRIRKKMFENYTKEWSLLRLFSDGTPLDIPFVEKGQKKKVKARELQYTFLINSQVKVLKKGFIGRRRKIQTGLRCLKKEDNKIGLLLHGTGGLGKSCLAGKFCDRFKDYTLIVVHGKLSTSTFQKALEDAFMRKNDNIGREILKEGEELPYKIGKLCSSVFQENNYLIILDDFEKNLGDEKKGNPKISVGAKPIIESLLSFLPYSGKMTQLIITSRYEFSLKNKNINLVKDRLESIGLTSFRGADEKKKVSELKNIEEYSDEETKNKLIKLGSGNPRLMEYLDTLISDVKDLDVESLLSKAKGKQEEFIQELVLREIKENQSEEFQNFLCRSAIYRIPIPTNAIEQLCGDIDNWKTNLEISVHLSLMEEDSTCRDIAFYWVSPLLREDIFNELSEEEIKESHQKAVSYYQNILSATKSYFPVFGKELIEHSLKAGMQDVVLEEGARLLSYLSETLAYREALEQGKYIISQISETKRDEKYSKFIFVLGYIYGDLGDSKQELEYLEQVLSIEKDIYGERHPNVATVLNNIGEVWRSLGNPKKAIKYYNQALSIDKEIYGQKHPHVAITINNIGAAWDEIGEHKKAIEYYEQSLSINKEVYGEKHPDVAIYLNNIGMAWRSLGNPKKAI